MERKYFSEFDFPETKTCIACGESKLIMFFRIIRKGKYIFPSGKCTLCENEYFRAYRMKRGISEKEKEYQKEYHKKYRNTAKRVQYNINYALMRKLKIPSIPFTSMMGIIK